ncbi:hypothetical protein GCM10007885_12990 [Methylobacterium gnaphalii]|nr:hypothetical protein GCM10007885_12990 [Methylobacterium gnaphalii]
MLGQGVAQFAQEEFGLRLIEGEDQIRMRLDRRQAVVGVSRFGRDVTLLRKPLRTAAGARHAHPEPRRRPMEGSAPGHGRYDAFAQIDRQR